MAELLPCTACPREVIYDQRIERLRILREKHTVGAEAILDDDTARMFAEMLHEQGDLEDPDDLATVRKFVSATFEFYDRMEKNLTDRRAAEEALCIGALRVCGVRDTTRTEVTVCNTPNSSKPGNIEPTIVSRTSVDKY